MATIGGIQKYLRGKKKKSHVGGVKGDCGGDQKVANMHKVEERRSGVKGITGGEKMQPT